MMEIPKNLNEEIVNYCKVNNINDIDEFIVKLLKQGFTVEKFGATPQAKEKIVEKVVEKIIEKEVPVEKIVEVPVQVDNSELMSQYTNMKDLYDKLKIEFDNQHNVLETIKKELDIEKKKNKKDIYGED